MKNFLGSFYLFSKLIISFVLLISLIGLLYILYTGYKKEDILSQGKINKEEVIRKNVKNNSDLIINLSKEIKITQNSIQDLKTLIENSIKQDKQENILVLKNNIQELNNNLGLISKDIEKIKKDNLSSNSISSKDKLLKNEYDNSEILDLILLKYENNFNFDKELDYLKKISSENKKNNFEKLLILSNKPFKGYNYINSKFNEEVNLYLKKIVNKNPSSLFNKIILPYLEISPSSENVIEDDLILKIKNIETQITNNNIDEAYNQMKYIENYENIFELSFKEIVKLIDFKTELMRFKQ